MPKAAAKPISKSFSAVLTATGKGLRWVVIQIPFDAVKVWGTRGHLRVKGEINGFAFRSSLFPTGDGHHILMINKQMQKLAAYLLSDPPEWTAGKIETAMDAEDESVLLLEYPVPVHIVYWTAWVDSGGVLQNVYGYDHPVKKGSIL